VLRVVDMEYVAEKAQCLHRVILQMQLSAVGRQHPT